MIENILIALSAPTLWVLNLPPYIGYTLLGLLVMATIILNGLALAKMRFSPLWSLLLLVPVISVICYWVAACKKWPVEKQAEKQA